MRIAKLLGGAGLLVATALVGGTLIGSALAVPTGDGSNTTPLDATGPLFGGDGEYCDIFLETFAGELGVGTDELLPAAQAAAVAAIDAAVANGDMEEERAAALKDRIQAMEEAGCGIGWAFGRGFAAGHVRGFMHADVLDAAAEELGLESADLIERLGDGTTLEDVAAEQGISHDDVKTAVITAVQADLDAAVAEGLDQARADEILDRVHAWLDEGGELRLRGMGGRGPGQRGGPWH